MGGPGGSGRDAGASLRLTAVQQRARTDQEHVVVRLGHYKGSQAGASSLRNALGILMQAVPGRP